MDALQKYSQDHFLERAIGYLRAGYPTMSLACEPLEDFGREGMGMAFALGIERECDVIRYLEMLLIWSQRRGAAMPDWAVELLNTSQVPPEKKVDLIYSRMLREL